VNQYKEDGEMVKQLSVLIAALLLSTGLVFAQEAAEAPVEADALAQNEMMDDAMMDDAMMNEAIEDSGEAEMMNEEMMNEEMMDGAMMEEGAAGEELAAEAAMEEEPVLAEAAPEADNKY
jgi:hypothetical protein